MVIKAFNRNVIVVNYSPPFTSIYKYATEIIQCLGDNGTLVNLAYSNKGGRWNSVHEGRTFSGVFKDITSANVLMSPLCFRNAAKYIRSSRGSSMLLHYVHQNINPLMKLDDRTIVTVHDNPLTNFKEGIYLEAGGSTTRKIKISIYSKIQARTVRKYTSAANVITHSNYVRNALIDFGFTGNISTIYPPVGTHFRQLKQSKQELRKKLGIPVEKKIVLSVSTSQPRKNLPTVEKVMNFLGEDFFLVRIGQKLNTGIAFSNVSNETVNEIYNASDVLLFPTLEEGFGSPLPEAFAVGLPVVASNIPVILEIAGDSAIFVDPMDVQSIAESVKVAISEGQELARKGLARSNLFSYSRFCENLKVYYDSIR